MILLFIHISWWLSQSTVQSVVDDDDDRYNDCRPVSAAIEFLLLWPLRWPMNAIPCTCTCLRLHKEIAPSTASTLHTVQRVQFCICIAYIYYKVCLYPSTATASCDGCSSFKLHAKLISSECSRWIKLKILLSFSLNSNALIKKIKLNAQQFYTKVIALGVIKATIVKRASVIGRFLYGNFVLTFINTWMW